MFLIILHTITVLKGRAESLWVQTFSDATAKAVDSTGNRQTSANSFLIFVFDFNFKVNIFATIKYKSMVQNKNFHHTKQWGNTKSNIPHEGLLNQHFPWFNICVAKGGLKNHYVLVHYKKNKENEKKNPKYWQGFWQFWNYLKIFLPAGLV